MRELSLHALDLIENSIRAGATEVAVEIAEDSAGDSLRLTIEDNGPGLPEGFDEAKMPFYTTKTGKKVGLGLSLFRATAEEAGGGMTLSRSPMGGLRVSGGMKISHIDRKPLGDMAGTLRAIACTNPDMELRFTARRGTEERSASLAGIRAGRGAGGLGAIAAAGRFADAARVCMEILDTSE